MDGTLLSAGGAGKRALRVALEAVYGRSGEIDGYAMGGRTDPEIVRDLLLGAGLSREEVDARLDALWEVYLPALVREVAEAPVHPLPGAVSLLARVEAEGGAVVPGLLTGNVVEGARVKVEAAGFAFRRFPVGAYGSDHWRRPALPALAAERARARTGIDFRGKEIVIIGDTPFDVACALPSGARTIAVASGGHDVETLAACAPDHLFADLTDVDAVWAAIAG